MSVEISHYCNNTNPNDIVVSIGRLDLFFSYETIVAFRDDELSCCRVNSWGPTTGKHLNAIQPDKSKRVSGEIFEDRLAEMLRAYNLA